MRVKPELSTEAVVKALKSHVFQTPAGERGNTFAILDGAAVPDLLDHLYADPRPEFVCLYRGELEPDMAEVAPYLVRLEPEARFTDWLLAEGWGRHWGIFAHTRRDLKTVRKHLRGFLMVLTPESKQVYFRYYDPRVIPLFLSTCDAYQLNRVFGPLTCYLCEGDDPAEIIGHQFNGKELVVERSVLGTVPNGIESTPPSPIVHKVEAMPGPQGQELFMSIRSEQMESLAAPRRRQLPRKIAHFLRAECPKQVMAMADAQLETFVLEQISRAQRHGLAVEWDVCRFCWLAALYGPKFDDERDWARLVFSDAASDPNRMDLLEFHHRNHIQPMFNPA